VEAALVAGIVVCLVLIPWIESMTGRPGPAQGYSEGAVAEIDLEPFGLTGDLEAFASFRLAAGRARKQARGYGYHDASKVLEDWDL
jgi:hypothetical protein